MATQIHGPRKKRTRQHVIADLSVHHLEGFILEESHTVQRLGADYGYDLVMFTYDLQGYIEPGMVFFQLKAAEKLKTLGGDYIFDLDIRDYHLWMLERAPVILVLFDASRKRAFWLAIQDYFRQDLGHQPKKGSKTVRVHVPKGQMVTRKAIARIRQLKQEKQERVLGVPS